MTATQPNSTPAEPPSTPTPTLRSHHQETSPIAGPSRSPLTRTSSRISASPRRPATADSPSRPIRARTRTVSAGGGSGSPVQAKKVEMELPPPGPECLQPAEFSPLNNGVGGRGVAWSDSPWLSPEDDPDATRGIPIFRPTMEEFKDFEGYVTKTVPWGQYSGIVKIIPPAEWIDALPPITKQSLADVRIKSPIQQNMLGKAGLFRVTNVEKNKAKPFTVQQWYEKCMDKKHAAPGPKELDRTLDRDSKEAKEKRAAEQAAMKAKRQERKEKLLAKRKAQGVQADSDRDADDIELVPPLVPHSPHSQSSADPIATTPEAEPIDPFYHNFDPETAWLPKDTRPEDYTAEACLNLEKRLWKSLMTREPSWYGADLQGSLFVDKETPWNVSNLPNLLNRCRLTKTLPGVNSPYLYFGMWGAMFAWHVEDMDLFSINYIHFGAPKFWYAVPQRHAERFEHVLAGYFPQDAQRCDQFLRHKSFTMSSTQLANDRIPVNMLVHNQHEFVITYPKGYHAGFNMGFNCAESINFALESWLELGRRAKVCECVSHSVRINVDEMMAERELEEAIHEERAKRPYRKRAAVSTEPRKRVRIVEADEVPNVEGSQAEEGTEVNTEEKPIMPITGLEHVKKRIRISKPPKPSIVKEIPSYPCLLCPSLSTEGLIPVLDPSEAVKAHSRSRDGSIMAHHACAVAIPELDLQEVDIDGVPVMHVASTDLIPNDRWNLKCACCSDKRLQSMGAKIQCTKGKCPRAYHVSCATTNETIQYRTYEITDWQPLPQPEDAAPDAQPEMYQVTDVRYELLCPTHNPDMKEVRKMKQLQDLSKRVMALLPGSTIKIKAGNATHEVTLVSSNPETRNCEVRYQDGLVLIIPFERVDFRTKTQLVENEYARTYHTNVAAGVSSPIKKTFAESPAPQPPLHFRQTRDSHKSASRHDGSRVGPDVPHPQHKHIHPPPPPLARSVQPAPRPQTTSHAAPHYPVDRRPSHPSAYRVHELLNPAPPQPQHIPSRVVVCDRCPSHATNGYYHQYAGPSSFHHGTGPGYYSTPSTSSIPHGYVPPAPYAYHRGSQSHQPPPLQVYPPPVQRGPAITGWAPDPHAPHSNGYPQPPVPVPSVDRSGYVRPSPAQPPVQQAPSDRSGKIDLRLEHMQALMYRLMPIRVPAIHIAGTNGKGSVSAILESCLLSAGIKVGRYNSPHLIEPCDAVRINGMPVNRASYHKAITMVRSVAITHQIQVSPFEIATAAAYYLFNMEPGLEVMIIECGMGGVSDATNVIPPDLVLASALTSVGLDHTSFLGTTLEAITEQKAGIAVRNGLLFLAPHLPREVKATAWSVGDQRGAAVIESGRSVKLASGNAPFDILAGTEPPASMISTGLPILRHDASSSTPPPRIQTHLPLGGAHQLDNLSLALTILHVLAQDRRALSLVPSLARLDATVIQRGVATTRWEGRCSWLKWKDQASGHIIPLLVDGAHNADSAATLRAYIDDLRLTNPSVRFIVSLSASPGKSIQSVLAPLLRQGDDMGLVDFSTPVEDMPWVKPCPKGEVRDVAASLVGAGGEVREFGSSGVGALKEALAWAGEEWMGRDGEGNGRVASTPKLTVVCGSLYLVADVYRLIGRGG